MRFYSIHNCIFQLNISIKGILFKRAKKFFPLKFIWKSLAKFYADLLEGFGKTSNGPEFVSDCEGKLSITEFADILSFMDDNLQQRFLAKFKEKKSNFAGELKKEMTISGLKRFKDDSISLSAIILK